MSLTVSREVDLVQVIEEAERTYHGVQDFLGLRALGNLYWLIAEKHRGSDISRIAVVEWFEKAKGAYATALSAYRAQSEFQITGFESYLEQRLTDVENLIRIVAPWNYQPKPSRIEERDLQLANAR